jgi:hypothetical protein
MAENNKENLKIQLELFADFWKRPPSAKIMINNKVHFDGVVEGTSQNPTLVEFTHECENDKQYELIIERSGKDKYQTVLDQGKIVKDQLLHIKTIIVDDIELGTLIYEGEYIPNYPEPWASQQKKAGNDLPVSFKNVTTLGHNGTWKLPFTSPFYMWLLENLY